MFFLHLHRKKEKFFPFTASLLLSSFGILLMNSLLGVYAYFIAQSHINNVITFNALDSENKYDQLNVTKAANKKFITLHRDHVLSFISAFQNIPALNVSLIVPVVIVCIRFHNFQTQCFANKRAPPLA
ncbi:hypothetical protein [Bartonella quintana]|uniref:Uncharacterized protein n=3 Tax=Bartonella quintana TaxID=803 RepID=A0A0H3LUJ5_BARQU|nr:hypothetical protein [Bartonella quintana]ETS13246.1 hypothetical protein Q651_00198 [Bartonella quintana BQ2-D70]ETS14097.1 hypothetical protein Q650_00718 [Bartonella quintana JK 73rel]ETS15784.1 hypothetical protein Q649_00727 [Bartonella quintana JK 73]ETS17787.1 hypothetical protein Q647_00716 [Bartonella quintana JK 7]ETS18616.1 hypothetical protein Q648_00305 [Bartonella quintana JK 12]